MKSMGIGVRRRHAPRSRRGLSCLQSSGAAGFETLECRRLLAFAPPVTYPIANVPLGIAAGDFNGDGTLDMVTANAWTGAPNLSILLGNGDGTFQQPTNVSVASIHAPLSLAVGDFNRDGKLDIAECNGTQVGVFLGNGDGTFQQPLYTDAGSPGKLAVGDFNGDCKLDVAVTDFAGMDVNVVLGNGDGTFAAPVSYAVGKLPNSEIIGGLVDQTGVIAVGDVNGDGKLDILTASSNVQQVSVLLGRGDGTFAPSLNYAVDPTLPESVRKFGIMGAGPDSIATGDLNGDGRPDIVVANRFAKTVSVLLGNGDGTYQPAVNYASAGAGDVAIGDFNHDGQLDIVTANSDANSVSVLYGRGDGTFQTHVDVPAGAGPTALVVGDFNRDGRPDMAIAEVVYSYGAPTSHSVSVVLNAPTPNEKFVSEVYHQLLGRPVDPGAAAYWNSFLASGGSREQMTLIVEGSLEYRANEVSAVYQKYLHRAPDAAGWRYYSGT